MNEMIYSKAPIADNRTSVDLVSNDEFDASFFRKLESANIKLNNNQIKAVRHYNNPALVLSVAGCGKTSTLTSRLAYLIEIRSIKPQNILLLTFTNKAAKEMKERVNKVFPNLALQINNVTSGTYHSVFLDILRKKGDTREIWSSSKSKEITIKTILRTLGIEKNYQSENILSLISHYKNNLMGLDDIPNKKKPEKEFYNIFQKYEEHKRNSGLMDFDDMLFDTYTMFKRNPKTLNEVRNQFKYIMIDEGQDNNELQFELVKMIALPENNIFLVADDDQTIFSFNGAKSENVLNFDQTYSNAEIITLDTNYRSTDTILGLANYVIKDNLNRREKVSQSVKPSNIHPVFITPNSVEDEANEIVNQIRESVSNGTHKYSDYAILHRTGSNARAIFEELLLQDIPFLNYNAEEVFYENSIVKPIVSYLRLTFDGKDIKAIGDVLPTLYLGKDKLEYIKSKQKKDKIEHPMEHLLSAGLKPFQHNKLSEKIRQIQRLKNIRPIVAIRSLREDYEQFLIGDDNETTTTLHREIIRETISELESASKKFSSNQDFIEYIDKIIKNTRIQKEIQKKGNISDAVNLMTLHKSKGLEFRHVFLISMCDGVLPHKSALETCTDVIASNDNFSPLEEERRLLYVGITRAQEELTISVPQTFRNKPAEPSRFLVEFITNDINDSEDEKTEKELEIVFR